MGLTAECGGGDRCARVSHRGGREVVRGHRLLIGGAPWGVLRAWGQALAVRV